MCAPPGGDERIKPGWHTSASRLDCCLKLEVSFRNVSGEHLFCGKRRRLSLSSASSPSPMGDSASLGAITQKFSRLFPAWISAAPWAGRGGYPRVTYAGSVPSHVAGDPRRNRMTMLLFLLTTLIIYHVVQKLFNWYTHKGISKEPRCRVNSGILTFNVYKLLPPERFLSSVKIFMCKLF